MAFDVILADRIRKQLARRKNFAEKKMFGGVCFLLNGNMCCGVLGDELIVRVTPEQATALLKEKHTRVFDFTGKPSKNMLYVGTKAIEKETDLKKWLERTLKFVRTLPSKR